MQLALLVLLGCWRPSAYEPPPPPDDIGEPDDFGHAEGTGDAPPDEGATAPDDEAGKTQDGEPESGPADDAPEQEAEADAPPPMQPFPVRTLQGPVSLVDDMGVLVTVIPNAGAALEARALEPIRAKVWCGTCTPAVEGWIQIQLIERTDGAPLVPPN